MLACRNHLIDGVRAAAVTACLVTFVLNCCATGQTAPAPGKLDRSPAAAFAQAVRILTDEARQSLDKQQLARPAANFADAFKDQIPPKLLTSKIIGPLHDDPFIDAYIRWQLTSFKPQLPDLNARQFEALLDDLPDLVENPRADRALIDSLIQAANAGALTASQQEAINQKLNDLSGRASRAAALNQAALGLRAWLRNQLPKIGERALLAGVEHCAALVDAGWPIDEIKSRLDEDFKAADRDRKFTDDQRRRVADDLQSHIGKRTFMIASAAIRDGTLAVEYTDAGIYDFDVRRWQRSILRKD